jgi:hypothetical protein
MDAEVKPQKTPEELDQFCRENGFIGWYAIQSNTSSCFM